jgi:hypothetical protein
MYSEYQKKIRKLLSSDSPSTNWNVALETHLSMISVIQHERIIHLMVTIFVGVAMILTCLTTIVTGKPYLLLLDFPLIALFMGYIFHYRYLENTTQSWYKITDLLREKVSVKV